MVATNLLKELIRHLSRNASHLLAMKRHSGLLQLISYSENSVKKERDLTLAQRPISACIQLLKELVNGAGMLSGGIAAAHRCKDCGNGFHRSELDLRINLLLHGRCVGNCREEEGVDRGVQLGARTERALQCVGERGVVDGSAPAWEECAHQRGERKLSKLGAQLRYITTTSTRGCWSSRAESGGGIFHAATRRDDARLRFRTAYDIVTHHSAIVRLLGYNSNNDNVIDMSLSMYD